MSKPFVPAYTTRTQSPKVWTFLVIGLLATGILVVMLPIASSLFQCTPNPAVQCATVGRFGQTTSTGYVNVATTRNSIFSGSVFSVLSAAISGGSIGSSVADISVATIIYPGTATTAGEVKAGCQNFYSGLTCALGGESVSATFTVVDITSGTTFRPTSWSFRLDVGDSEIFVIQLASLTAGHTYSFTLTETVNTVFSGVQTINSQVSIVWPPTASVLV